jgi:hypothetical protein
VTERAPAAPPTSLLRWTTKSRLSSRARLLHRPGNPQLGAGRRRRRRRSRLARRSHSAIEMHEVLAQTHIVRPSKRRARAAASRSISVSLCVARLLPPHARAQRSAPVLPVVRGSSHPTRTLASGVEQQRPPLGRPHGATCVRCRAGIFASTPTVSGMRRVSSAGPETTSPSVRRRNRCSRGVVPEQPRGRSSSGLSDGGRISSGCEPDETTPFCGWAAGLRLRRQRVPRGCSALRQAATDHSLDLL